MQASSSSTLSTQSTLSSSSIAASFEHGQTLKPCMTKYEERTNAILYWIGKDGQSFSSTQCPGFQHMIHVMVPKYQIPDKSTFSRRTEKIYDTTRASVLTELEGVKFFAATSDMWSSYGMVPYMGYSIHWIDDEWRLRTRSLGTRFVPDDQT